MRRLRLRQTVALVAIAGLLFASVVVACSPDGPLAAILSPLWLVIPAILVVIVRRLAARCDVQTVSLLSLLFSRAPPAGFLA